MIKNWLEAFRLRTIHLSVSGILMGSFLAFHNGFYNLTIFFLSILTTIFYQILSNLANDLGDSLKGTDNSNRVGPTRSVQSGKITKYQMKVAVIICSALAGLSSILLILVAKKGMPEFMYVNYGILALLCILAAITYTIGKKAYGYLGLGDLMVFIFFGLVGVLGSYTLFSKEIHYLILLPGTSIGLLSTAVLNLNNMRDHENDALSNKNTLVVKIGFKNAKFYHSTLFILSLISLLVYGFLSENYSFLLACAPFLMAIAHLKKVFACQVPKELDSELKKIALMTLFVSLLGGLGLFLGNKLF